MPDWNTDRQLTGLFAEIARADERLEPSPRIEQHVMKSWDTTIRGRVERDRGTLGFPGVRGPIGRRWAALASVGLAVMAVAGLLASRWPASSREHEVPSGREAQSPVANGVTLEPTPDGRAAAGSAVGNASVARSGGNSVRTSSERVSAGPEANPGFYPIGPDAEQALRGPFRVARVRLPRDVLADLGVVPDVSRVGEPVQADVVFGEDGLARAIRLVPVTGRLR